MNDFFCSVKDCFSTGPFTVKQGYLLCLKHQGELS